MKKRILPIFIALIVVVLTACSTSTVNSVTKDAQDQLANISDANNEYVLMVKGGHPIDYPNTTYDEAFSNFFASPTWKYFKADSGEDVVEFTGECLYEEVNVKARLQFAVDKAAGTFEAGALSFNDVPQTELIKYILLAKAFESDDSDRSSDSPDVSSSNPSDSSSLILHVADGRLSMGKIVLYEGTFIDFGNEVEKMGLTFEINKGTDADADAYCLTDSGIAVARIGAHPRSPLPVEGQKPWVVTVYYMEQMGFAVDYLAVNDELGVNMTRNEVLAIAKNSQAVLSINETSEMVDGEQCDSVQIDYGSYRIWYNYMPSGNVKIIASSVESSVPTKSSPQSRQSNDNDTYEIINNQTDPIYFDMYMRNCFGDVCDALTDYYKGYLSAINEQDERYLTNVSPEQADYLKERIFGVNKNDFFAFEQISIDLDTVEFWSYPDFLGVSFHAAFQFGNRPRSETGSLEHGANVQIIFMSQDYSSYSWEVTHSEVLTGTTIGNSQRVIK